MKRFPLAEVLGDIIAVIALALIAIGLMYGLPILIQEPPQ